MHDLDLPRGEERELVLVGRSANVGSPDYGGTRAAEVAL
jgi:hypothetical protein